MWLSPLRIGEHDERLLAGLSDVDPGRPELDHPLDLRGLVRRPQVEVVAVLALLRPGARLQPHGRLTARRWHQMGGPVRLPSDLVPEDLRPELRHPPDVLHVQRPLRDPARHR